MEALRSLGVMHVRQAGRVESDDVAFLTQRISDTTKVFNILGARKPSGHSAEPIPADRLVTESLERLEEDAALSKQKDAILKDMEKLSVWGDFEPETLARLRESGIFVYLCSAYKKEMEHLDLPETAAVTVVNTIRGEFFFLITSQTPLDAAGLPVVSLPNASLSRLKESLKECESKLAEVSSKLDLLALSLGELPAYKASLETDLEFAQNRDGMAKEGVIAYLQGYVPVTEIETLRTAALNCGWALKIEDPAEDDAAVPTYIKKPKWMNIIDPLFDFIGISPGYRENDVSLFFLIAFPIFFGMLIGDFAYGMLFLVTAVLCK